jgi:glycosyltransferase involved in cell wall biosynthesis
MRSQVEAKPPAHVADRLQRGRKPSKETLRVAYITTVPVLGGAELNLLRVLPYLQREGVVPTILMAPPGGGLLERYQAAGFRTHAFHLYGKRWRSFWRYCQSLYELTTPLVSGNVDLVHINHHYALEYTTLAARLARLPCVVHIRCIEPPEWIYGNLKHLNSVSRLIAVSQAVKDRLQYASVSTSHTRIVYNGVDSKLIQIINDGVPGPNLRDNALSVRSQVREEFQISGNAPLVGLIARLEPLKGVADFLRASSVIKRTLNDARFMIVGAGNPEYIAELQALASHLGITGTVLLTGFRTDIDRILSALDVLVVATYDPLTGQGESLSNIALESMVAGTPVVARRVGGIAEVLADGRGVLVDPDGIEPLADGILRTLCMSADERRVMMEKGFRAVSLQFTLQNQARQTRSVYDEIMNRHALE